MLEFQLFDTRWCYKGCTSDVWCVCVCVRTGPWRKERDDLVLWFELWGVLRGTRFRPPQVTKTTVLGVLFVQICCQKTLSQSTINYHLLLLHVNILLLTRGRQLALRRRHASRGGVMLWTVFCWVTWLSCGCYFDP